MVGVVPWSPPQDPQVLQPGGCMYWVLPGSDSDSVMSYLAPHPPPPPGSIWFLLKKLRGLAIWW